MLKDARYNQAFLAHQGTCRDPSGHILRRYHFCHHSTGGVRSSHEHWTKVKLVGRHHLQIAEESITGSVAATQEHAVILEAIQGGEPDTAAQAMQVHLEWALDHSKQEVRRRLGIEAAD